MQTFECLILSKLKNNFIPITLSNKSRLLKKRIIVKDDCILVQFNFWKKLHIDMDDIIKVIEISPKEQDISLAFSFKGYHYENPFYTKDKFQNTKGYIIKYKDGNTISYVTFLLNDFDRLKPLMEWHFDVETKDIDQENPLLHEALGKKVLFYPLATLMVGILISTIGYFHMPSPFSFMLLFAIALVTGYFLLWYPFYIRYIWRLENGS